MLSAADRHFLSAVAQLVYANPFSHGMLEAEKSALGSQAIEEEPVWSFNVSDPDRLRANTWLIMDRLPRRLATLREHLAASHTPLPAEIALYEDCAFYHLYYRYYERFVAGTFHKTGEKNRWHFFREFAREWSDLFAFAGDQLDSRGEPKHIFACYYQVVRAFHHIFEQIIGNSEPAARLRASVWQSVFTHDIRRYRNSMFARMNEFATLITGPSGTGKEVVARAIALSRYVPFDDNRMSFEGELDSLFFPINIAALPTPLVESELFGHKRGAFTGAVEDRRGWLSACPPLGAVFLDEIGDLDADVQVKLLRVIETRSFQTLGESKAAPQRFLGKLIAATNRDLCTAMHTRTFREDLYYRLCSDQIRTPSLREQINESPQVLHDLILFLSRRVAGDAAEAIAREAETWVTTHMDPNYGWPGNYRELEQCIRNILIRKEYHPPTGLDQTNNLDVFKEARPGSLTAEQLLVRYCTLVYSQTGTYEGTAQKLGLDRRTVKAKVDKQLLQKLRA